MVAQQNSRVVGAPGSGMSDPQRWTNRASEAAVIVASILLAFWIDAWWGERQARVAELSALESLREEAEANRADLDSILRFNRRDLDRTDRFLVLEPREMLPLPSDSVAQWLEALTVTWTYDGDLSATGLFLDSPTQVTVKGREVREVAARWARLVEDAEEEKATFWELGKDVTSQLASRAAPVANQGQGFLNEVTSRLGPSVLAELRADDAFVALVLHKAHYQNIYLFELSLASVVLDSLRSTLR